MYDPRSIPLPFFFVRSWRGCRGVHAEKGKASIDTLHTVENTEPPRRRVHWSCVSLPRVVLRVLRIRLIVLVNRGAPSPHPERRTRGGQHGACACLLSFSLARLVSFFTLHPFASFHLFRLTEFTLRTLCCCCCCWSLLLLSLLLLSSSFSSICIHIFVSSFFLIYIFVCFFPLNDTLNRSLCRVIPPNHVSHECERQRAR